MIADRFLVDPGADDALFAAAYNELKRLAHVQLRTRGSGATLNTTELVHEAFLKLSRGNAAGWENRAHFFGAAARAMRQLLVDFAQRRGAAKRGGGTPTVTFRDAMVSVDVELDQMLALDGALQHLDAVNPRLRHVVELRFFGGVPEQEIAQMLGVSERTVERDWLKARLFLLNELRPHGC